jgi:hypothetical protein
LTVKTGAGRGKRKGFKPASDIKIIPPNS